MLLELASQKGFGNVSRANIPSTIVLKNAFYYIIFRVSISLVSILLPVELPCIRVVSINNYINPLPCIRGRVSGFCLYYIALNKNYIYSTFP